MKGLLKFGENSKKYEEIFADHESRISVITEMADMAKLRVQQLEIKLKKSNFASEGETVSHDTSVRNEKVARVDVYQNTMSKDFKSLDVTDNSFNLDDSKIGMLKPGLDLQDEYSNYLEEKREKKSQKASQSSEKSNFAKKQNSISMPKKLKHEKMNFNTFKNLTPPAGLKNSSETEKKLHNKPPVSRNHLM